MTTGLPPRHQGNTSKKNPQRSNPTGYTDQPVPSTREEKLMLHRLKCTSKADQPAPSTREEDNTTRFNLKATYHGNGYSYIDVISIAKEAMQAFEAAKPKDKGQTAIDAIRPLFIASMSTVPHHSYFQTTSNAQLCHNMLSRQKEKCKALKNETDKKAASKLLENMNKVVEYLKDNDTEFSEQLDNAIKKYAPAAAPNAHIDPATLPAAWRETKKEKSPPS